MKLSGDSTWVISSGDGGTFPLFVRDALGISTPTADSIPRLTPAVPAVTGVLVPPEFTPDWDRWWRDTTENGWGREPIGIGVELREAYTRWIGDDLNRRRGPAIFFSESIHEVVTDLERELGRRLIFTLEVLQLPVEGQFWRRITRDKVLASHELMGSRNLLAPLESVIRDLAQ